ncbi:peptidylprolyl isomerase [Xanthomonadaceae bacterium JHOS43]|nr:peptidylprolyl isomerase [Xanthomonadaceae bacterium JHOS43]
MTRIAFLRLAFCLYPFALVACGGPDATSAGAETALRYPAEDAIALSVNGEGISEAMLVRIARVRGFDLSDSAQREQVIDLAVETVLLAQDAIASGLAARPDVRTELDLVRVQALAARNLADTRAGMALSDEQLREFYQQVIAQTGTRELHLRNALYVDEAAAIAAASAAVASADFAVWLAGAEASGAQQAGDLGWANIAQLPPELAKAALALPDGGVSVAPVRTRFGWHVIQRVASRQFTPPPFEDVRDGILKQAGDKHLEEKIAGLRTKATIRPMEAN